jgi:hypothetical protein
VVRVPVIVTSYVGPTQRGRDVSPQSGTVTAAGAATSAAVPSANDLVGDDVDDDNEDTMNIQSNGAASSL